MVELRQADVAVVGAGPAGIAAAVRAAESGRSVLLLDEAPFPGGQIWKRGPGTRLPSAARRWDERLARSGVRLLTGVSVVDATPGFRLLAEAPDGPMRVVAPRLVLATGARERFLPFPGWTLPGVLGVGAAQALLKSGASFSGCRTVVAGTGPLLLPVAAALAADGAAVAAVLEQAPGARVVRFGLSLWRHPGKLAGAARYRARFLEARYSAGAWVMSASGRERVASVRVTDGRREWTISCDLLCAAFGLVPNTELARLLGCETADGFVRVDARQETSVPGIFCAGEPTGIAGVETSLVEGQIAGAAAAGVPAPTALVRRRSRGARFAVSMAKAFSLREELRSLPQAGTIVCRCEDVTYGRLDPVFAAREAKLATRIGMGPCQGRVCGPAAEFLFRWTGDTIRPPAKAALISTLAAEDPE